MATSSARLIVHGAAAASKPAPYPPGSHPRASISLPSAANASSIWGSKSIKPQRIATFSPAIKPAAPVIAMAGDTPSRQISGKCFVVRDNIDTDQIIPAEYLTLVPSKPDEYEKLGSYAMAGLPPHYGQFMEPGKSKTKYSIIIAGSNFGCGSSREHAPVALGASGIQVVVAESYARIFFRNSVATGEMYPVECEARICDEFHNGDDVTVDMERDVVVNHSTGKEYALKPLGDAAPVIEAGGIFAYARQTGMIPSAA
ncbi:3-isopropylmalate dehydratase small subunit 3 [Selaginella moellendorffii]|nr:3-isopropylmalate dehydratase small subunit 3 [Selaginella moellendorffii]XP_002994768.2 3-isopropylmalate dehydratase small subunit 3 [Selaginella moellendorffii]|eukprot:XP_002984313.2 3-isopropylmalate dehydratase small subunit 3 [Selaginella moellendorffii]